MCLLSACLHCPCCRVTAPPLWEADCSFTRAQCLGAALTGRLSKMLVKRRLYNSQKDQKVWENYTQSSFSERVQRTGHCCCHSLSRHHSGLPPGTALSALWEKHTQAAFCGTFTWGIRDWNRGLSSAKTQVFFMNEVQVKNKQTKALYPSENRVLVNMSCEEHLQNKHLEDLKWPI